MTQPAMTRERLREIYGEPSPVAARKAIDHLDVHCRAFIDQSTFLVLATTDGESLDISPKGDPAGFVRVEDDHHLLIPDRPGNRRLDGLSNILVNPQVALIFLIPTVNETLRINGVAEISDEPNLCGRFKIKNRAPLTVTRIRVREAFTHCGKAPIRSGLWKPETWPDKRPVPTLAKMVRDHSNASVDEVSEAYIEKSYRENLY